MNTIKWAVVLNVLTPVMLCAVVGCDRLPSLQPPPLVAVGSDVVAEEGRGGYNWRLDGKIFETRRPTSFQFVDQLDTEMIRRNLEVPNFAEQDTPQKPDGMEEDVYAWFKRYWEPPAELRQILELEQSDDVGTKCTCISLDGARVLTVGNKLIEWDVNTGERMHEWKAPISNCISVAYGPSQKSVLLHSSTSLVKASLEDGRILHTWKPPAGTIQSFVSASAADAQSVLTSDNRLFSLASDFSKVREYKGNALTSKRVAIRHDGAWTLGVTKGAFLRWRPDSKDNSIEYMPSPAINEEYSQPMAGPLVDRWADPWFVHEFDGVQERLITSSDYPHLAVNLWILTAASATVDRTQDWMVVLGERADGEGRVTRFVQDVHFGAFEYSVPTPLPTMNIKGCFFDARGERLALVLDDKLRVVERPRWSDPDGLMTTQRIAALLTAGRIEQLELCAKQLRSQPIFRGGKRGEQIYGELAQQIGYCWANLEEKPAAPEVMNAIQAWYAQGSELAALASARRHLEIGSKARGSGYADTVTTSGWATLETRTRMALQDLTPLMRMDKPPARAFEEMIYVAIHTQHEQTVAEQWLKQSVELYPYEPAPLGGMCFWLLPRWGGNNGEGGALISALVEHYPKPAGEILYARVALSLVRAVSTPKIQQEAGFSIIRILDAVEPLLQQGHASRQEVEALMELARRTNRHDLVSKLADYHIEHFGLPAQFAYERNVVSSIAEAKKVKTNK